MDYLPGTLGRFSSVKIVVNVGCREAKEITGALKSMLAPVMESKRLEEFIFQITTKNFRQDLLVLQWQAFEVKDGVH